MLLVVVALKHRLELSATTIVQCDRGFHKNLGLGTKPWSTGLGRDNHSTLHEENVCLCNKQLP